MPRLLALPDAAEVLSIQAQDFIEEAYSQMLNITLSHS